MTGANDPGPLGRDDGSGELMNRVARCPLCLGSGGVPFSEIVRLLFRGPLSVTSALLAAILFLLGAIVSRRVFPLVALVAIASCSFQPVLQDAARSERVITLETARLERSLSVDVSSVASALAGVAPMLSSVAAFAASSSLVVEGLGERSGLVLEAARKDLEASATRPLYVALGVLALVVVLHALIVRRCPDRRELEGPGQPVPTDH